MSFKGTKEVAKLLGMTISALNQAIYHGRLTPAPNKGPGGAFLWTSEDIQRASWQLLGRPYSEPHAGSQGNVVC